MLYTTRVFLSSAIFNDFPSFQLGLSKNPKAKALTSLKQLLFCVIPKNNSLDYLVSNNRQTELLTEKLQKAFTRISLLKVYLNETFARDVVEGVNWMHNSIRNFRVYELLTFGGFGP